MNQILSWTIYVASIRVMTEIPLLTLEDIIEEFNSLPSHFIFRGHANASWKLESTLERVIGAKWCSEEAKKFEELSLARFRSKFHLYDRENIEPDSNLAWLAIMQHYGVPTRLLDFTESPYVALYFALETYRAASKDDFAVYALDYRAVTHASVASIRKSDSAFHYKDEDVFESQDAIFDRFVDPRNYDIAWITEPHKHNQRLDRQGGCFVVSGNRDRRLEDVLATDLYEECGVMKYCIPSELHPQVFALLRKMNLTGKVLYGDLHGLAVAIKMEMEAYST